MSQPIRSTSPRAARGTTGHRFGRSRLMPILTALLATLLALPVSAVTVPDVPLQSGNPYPPANILFILDDSGSMGNNFMPDVVPATTTINIASQAYPRNTIFYNPATVYQPWVDSSGNTLTGGTDYSDVYTDPNFLTGSSNLFSAIQTFYVPKNPANMTSAYLSDGANYYRYQIHTDGRVVQSEYLFNVSGSQGVAGRNCSNASGAVWRWKNCTYLTPTGRSEVDERLNFATWYSYHRTRMKVAKAGAGRAFIQQGNNIRVGFRTIWRRQLTGNPMTQAHPILVDQNQGLFDDPNGPTGADNNRSVWFDRLYGASANGATPLHGALTDAGLYYSDSDPNGAYGPEPVGSQLVCRQNFTILTSDGYWNGKANYTDIAGEQDNAAGTPISDPSGNTYTYTPARPYSSPDSDTLADVAMRYWKNDLRTDMDNLVPTSAADPAFWQHMATFAISIGAKGTLNPATDLPLITAGTLSWPTPVNNTIVNVDDMWHAAVNGHGDFVVATDPTEFATALSDALNTIQERGASASNVAANSTSFITDTRVYQASYVAGKWSGQLIAYKTTSAGIDTTDANGDDVPDTGWAASKNIPTPGARNILTWSGSGGTTFPTVSQTVALTRLIGTAPVTGTVNASYIRGDRSQERQNGGTLRNRTTPLGDIVNSSPFYVKDTQTIYVGANDGMLHGFDATDGKELFAYVPGGINLTDLRQLSDPYYAHKYFVDGPVVVSAHVQTPGKNYLVAALGRGGKGLFGLDVSTPASFNAGDVLWEQTSGADMGVILGQPLVVTLNDGSQGVITSNGINSSSGTAALYVLNIATGAVIRELDTGVTGGNGLSAPRGWDSDGDGTVDYVYAGDLKGNLWKFDLTGSTSGSWNIANGGSPMFVAKDSGGNRQPITAGLSLATEPVTGKLWVLFGTGSYLALTDVADTSTQSMYGLIDSGSTISGRAQLQTRTITAVSGNARAFEPQSPLTPGVEGWYIDLGIPKPGERIVSDPRVIGRVLLTASIIPDTEVCNSAGSGYINALDAFTGASLSANSYFDLNGDGNFGNDNLVDGNGNPVPIGSVDLGVGMPTRPILIDNLLVVGGSKAGGTTGSGLASVTVQPPPQRPRRVSWDEIRGN